MLYPFMYRGSVSDVNSAETDGYYETLQDVTNTPTGYTYGTLLVYGSYYKVQLYFPFIGNYVFKRSKQSSGQWSGWSMAEFVPLM